MNNTLKPLLFLLSSISLTLLIAASIIRVAMSGTASAADIEPPVIAEPESGIFVIEADQHGNTTCRTATLEETQAMMQHDLKPPLHVIYPLSRNRLQAQTGLKIILRATSQLEGFPETKAAFIRAAMTWEARIQNPITIVLDVDYGPNNFGQPFGSSTLGSTRTQTLGSNNIYPGIRSTLIAEASTAGETTLYNALPTDSIPTDIGSTAGMAAPSALLRALGEIPSVADPAGEQASFGDPPAIGFNSAFQFDFTPADGIDPGRTDFDAVAVHEIGHALGFSSRVGARELDPNSSLRVSLLDLFRLRPGTATGTFATAQRILSSGGEQIFFTGNSELKLSTGRSDGTGGDERQASHWKDDVLNQSLYLGVMDPRQPSGQRETLTENDLLALDFMGYRIRFSEPLPLTSGASVRVWGGSAPAGLCRLSALQQAIDVPEGATQLRIDLTGNGGNAALNARLFVRFNQSVTIQNGSFVADHASEGNGGGETVIISAASSPPLRAGRYYIAATNCSTSDASLTVSATISPQPGNATSVSAASFQLGGLASESIIAVFGVSLATATQAATSVPLPTSLAGTTVKVRDSNGTERLAPLFFVSAQQVNYQIPAGTAEGLATVTIIAGDGRTAISNLLISFLSPSLFTANSDGQGVAAAFVLRVKPGNVQTIEPVATFDSGQQKFVSVPIDFGSVDDQLFLVLFGTGIRGRSQLSAMSCTIGGISMPVEFAGAQGGFVGLDQVNVRLSRNLAGRGEVDLVLSADNIPANTVKVNFR